MLYRGFSTQEELDAQYNLRESVPDFPGYEEFYTEQSRKTREQLECMLDIPFGPTLAERLDIFPATRPEAPTVPIKTVDPKHGIRSARRNLLRLGR